jgi:hypothetical protein
MFDLDILCPSGVNDLDGRLKNAAMMNHFRDLSVVDHGFLFADQSAVLEDHLVIVNAEDVGSPLVRQNPAAFDRQQQR